jgi:hypothetical protein
MTTPTDDAVGTLARVLGDDPPAAMSTLDPAAVTQLADAIVAERQRQHIALGQAVEDALRLVPRPVRGIVRRLIT